MAATWKGTKGPLLVRDEAEYSAEGGFRVTKEFHGEKQAIYGMVPSFKRKGISFRISRIGGGPTYSMTAVWQDSPASGDDGIVWSITTETLQKSIYDLPEINTEIEASARPSSLRRAIQRAFEDGNQTIQDDFSDDQGGTYDQATYPNSYVALKELRRGAEFFEDETLVLRRRKTVSVLRTPIPMRLNIGQYIFSNAQLGLPNNVGFTLPDLSVQPTKPESQWGWRLRGHQSEFVGESLEQIHEFVLASWSTNIYTVSPGPFEALVS
jgi:hypothetical protein